MEFRKIRADQIFNGYRFLPANRVLVMDKNGTVREIVEQKDAGDSIEYYPGILSPGFINCHCHLELSHMKNVIPTGTGLVEFLLNVVQKRILPDLPSSNENKISDKEQAIKNA